MPLHREAVVLLAVLAFFSLSLGAPPGPGPQPRAVGSAPAPAGSPAELHAELAQRAPGLTPGEARAVAAAIDRESLRHGIDPRLVVAVIEVESNFDAFAVSSAGALGLMQLLPSTAEALARRAGVDWRGARTLFDPVTNVRLGIAYLGEMRDRFDHLPTALAAYNWGPAAIGRRVRDGAPVPSGYARRVMAVYSRADDAETAAS